VTANVFAVLGSVVFSPEKLGDATDAEIRTRVQISGTHNARYQHHQRLEHYFVYRKAGSPSGGGSEKLICRCGRNTPGFLRQHDR
jgi:hypothetical protein